MHMRAEGGEAMRLVLASALLLASVGEASARERRDVVRFALAERGTLVGVSAGAVDAGRSRPVALAVSDAMLEISVPDGDAAAALAATEDAVSGRRRGLFRLRFLAVVAGRLRPDATGWCAPWRRDESRCDIDCDGGTLMLRRGGSGLELTLSGGSSRAGDDDLLDDVRGVSVTACRTDVEGDVRLVPAGGQARTRLVFVER